MTKIDDARLFAKAAHHGQTRKGVGQEPYFIHLEEVAALVERFGGSETAIMAAWLHDTVEDCAVEPDDIRHRFGAGVAAVVAELTDDKSLPKPERKRMQVINAAGKSADAALVKLCDKISNIRAVAVSPPVHWPEDRKLAYVDWASEVVAALPNVRPEAGLTAFEDAVALARQSISQD